ncbi:MAG: lamin tail domain-containing protein [Chitinophagaceae bacterium]
MRRFLLPLSLLFVFTLSLSTIQAQMRITEYMYDGVNLEFIEFTNTGATPIDMTGYSFDDDSRLAGTVSLNAFGTVRAGESVILAENNATAFRTAWGLCNNVKVIGGLATNLGRNDEINLFDASAVLVDRLTFGDQNFPGTIRTQNKSGWVSATGLGTNTIAQWTLSIAPDAEGSFASTGGDIGSPGKSTRATVPYDPCPAGAMRITEFMYDGVNLEFIEFTNIGATAVDMTGYSFDDDSRLAGTVSLSAFGTVQPGESVILSENNAAAFKTAWNLCTGIKIIGGLATNLGRNDEINLFNSSSVLVDRLTFGDQNIPGSIRTQNKSGWVSAAGLGANNIAQWTLSAAVDAEGSVTSTGGDIGSPGKSTRAFVAYDPCTAVVAGAPTITIDVNTTTNYLDGGIITSPTSPYAISGVINDAADPAGTTGIDFTIGDDVTPVGSLIVTASSSNTTVVPLTNVILSGTDGSRNVKITAAGVGYSNITVSVNDGTNTTSYVINYAASQASSSSIQWSTSIADASAAIALDDNYMAIANDESNLLYVFDRHASGLPVKTFDFNSTNQLALTDGSTGNWKELDVEAAVRSLTHPNRTYWLGSMSNSSSFNDKPNRNRIVAIDITGTGAATTFTNAGYYGGLRSQLIIWGDANGYNFTASAADGKDPKTIDGFNAEGMVFGADNTTLFIGFRAPLVPMANRTKAVIAPVQNFETWFNNGSPVGNAVIGAPIELDLGGRDIRDIIRLSNNNYVIVAGSYDETSIPALYRWNGVPIDVPQLLPSFDLTGLNAEAAMGVNEGGQLSIDKLQIICDNGNNIFYNDGIAAKDLPQNAFKKFISEVLISSVAGVLPVHFEYFIAVKQLSNVQLDWKNGNTDDVVSFDIMRSENGSNYQLIQHVIAQPNQTTYSFTDINVPSRKLYYRIDAKDLSGRSYGSAIRFITADGAHESIVKIYPNPVSNGLFSIVSTQTGAKTVEVYTSSGMLYKHFSFTDQVKDVETNNWSKGYYLLRIITADGNVATEKVIVQ